MVKKEKKEENKKPLIHIVLFSMMLGIFIGGLFCFVFGFNQGIKSEELVTQQIFENSKSLSDIYEKRIDILNKNINIYESIVDDIMNNHTPNYKSLIKNDYCFCTESNYDTLVGIDKTFYCEKSLEDGSGSIRRRVDLLREDLQ